MTDRYGKVHASALEALAGNPTAVAVYSALTTWADESGECWPLRTTIASALAISQSTVGRALRALREAGVVRTRPRMSGNSKVGTIYTIVAFQGENGLTTGMVTGALPEWSPVTIRPARDRSSKRREQLTVNKEIPPTPQDPPPLAVVLPMPSGRLLDVPSSIDRVFDAWRAATGRTKARVVLTEKRRRMINARLKEGYDVEDLVDAVRGLAKSPFHNGANDDGTVWNDLKYAMRDGEAVEKFRDLERGTNRRTATARPPDPALDAVRRQRELEGRG